MYQSNQKLTSCLLQQIRVLMLIRDTMARLWKKVCGNGPLQFNRNQLLKEGRHGQTCYMLGIEVIWEGFKLKKIKIDGNNHVWVGPRIVKWL